MMTNATLVWLNGPKETPWSLLAPALADHVGGTAAHRCGRLCWLQINSARYGCAVAVRTGCLEQGRRGDARAPLGVCRLFALHGLRWLVGGQLPLTMCFVAGR